MALHLGNSPWLTLYYKSTYGFFQFGIIINDSVWRIILVQTFRQHMFLAMQGNDSMYTHNFNKYSQKAYGKIVPIFTLTDSGCNCYSILSFLLPMTLGEFSVIPNSSPYWMDGHQYLPWLCHLCLSYFNSNVMNPNDSLYCSRLRPFSCPGNAVWEWEPCTTQEGWWKQGDGSGGKAPSEWGAFRSEGRRCPQDWKNTLGWPE